MPTSEAPTSTLESADGPTDKRVDALNSTEITIGRNVAYSPVTSGMPAKPAYATDCGIITTATVSAEMDSPRSRSLLGRGQFRKGSQRDSCAIGPSMPAGTAHQRCGMSFTE